MSRQDRHEHDRTLELAASAIDYGLTAAQSATLDAHLSACPACARSAAAMRGDAFALRPRTTPLPSRRVDDAVSAAIAGHRAGSPSILVLVAAVALLVALLAVASVAGGLLLRTWWTPPTVEVAPSSVVAVDASPSAGPTTSPADARFDAVFIRPPADGDPTAASTIVAVGADGTERLLASVPNVATDLTAFVAWTALSETGHLALLMHDGDRAGWAILDVTDPGAKPIPIVLPGLDDTDRGWAVWGPGERLAIVLLPPTVDQQAVAFVDPTTGAATVYPLSIEKYGCIADRCVVWTADGSGVVVQQTDLPSGLVVLGPDGRVAPFGSRVWPSNIGDRDVNAAGELLLGGINPMDNPPFDNELLYVRAPGQDSRLALRLPGELPDRAWAADGRDVWLLSAQWLAASRPVTLERFSPPATRTVIASFVAAVDVPATDTYAPAASFAGIAPDDSLAVVSVVTTSSEPIVRQGKLVDLRSGASTDVDGSFVGWLPTQE